MATRKQSKVQKESRADKREDKDLRGMSKRKAAVTERAEGEKPDRKGGKSGRKR